jgi:hypothetical protein
MSATKLRPSVLTRIFAIACAIWLVGSLVIPALPISEGLFFTVVLRPVFLVGSFWPAMTAWVLWLPMAAWAAIPAGAALFAAKRLTRRRYKAAAGWTAFAALGALVMSYGSFLSDALRFQFQKRAYDRVVEDAHAGRCTAEDRQKWNVAIDEWHCSDPVVIIFVWGRFASMWHGVVYDAADEFTKPPTERSTEWKQRPIGALLSCSGVKMPLGGHYYRAGGHYTPDVDDCR